MRYFFRQRLSPQGNVLTTVLRIPRWCTGIIVLSCPQGSKIVHYTLYYHAPRDHNSALTTALSCSQGSLYNATTTALSPSQGSQDSALNQCTIICSWGSQHYTNKASPTLRNSRSALTTTLHTPWISRQSIHHNCQGSQDTALTTALLCSNGSQDSAITNPLNSQGSQDSAISDPFTNSQGFQNSTITNQLSKSQQSQDSALITALSHSWGPYNSALTTS